MYVYVCACVGAKVQGELVVRTQVVMMVTLDDRRGREGKEGANREKGGALTNGKGEVDCV